jgi:hypothetical protein
VRLHRRRGRGAGGREDLSMQIHGAMLALHTNRPVKLVYGARSRSSATCTATPRRSGPSTARRRRAPVCVRMRILLDGGRTRPPRPPSPRTSLARACRPPVANALIESTCVYTGNRRGAMRASARFRPCCQAQMDELGPCSHIDQSSSGC